MQPKFTPFLMTPDESYCKYICLTNLGSPSPKAKYTVNGIQHGFLLHYQH